MKSFPLRLLVSYLTILLSCSISYYTIYGLSKSTIEYFCIQKRGGSIVYSEVADFSFIRLSLLNHELNISGIIDNAQTIVLRPDPVNLIKGFYYDKYNNYKGRVGRNEFCKNLTSIKSNNENLFIDCEFGNKYLEINYKIIDEYFNIKCEPKYKPVFIIQSLNINGKTRSLLKEQITTIDANKQNDMFYTCQFEKRLETCQIKQKIQNDFIIYYLIFLGFSVLVLMLCVVNFKQRLFFRVLFGVFEMFKEMGLSESPFCNPITGRPVKLKKGDYFTVLTKEHTNDLDCYISMDRMSDLEGTYEIIGNNILVLMKDYRKLLSYQDVELRVVKKYFGMVNVNPNLCVSDGKTHFIKTLDVLLHIRDGYMVSKKLNTSEKYMLDIDKFDLDFLKTNFTIGDEIALKLLEHNKNFFKKGRIFFEPLFNLLNKKYSHFERPSYVNNSTWKWYGSDFKLIMESFGIMGYKSQVDWRKSYALIAAEVVPEIKIINEAKSVEISMIQNDLNKRLFSKELKEKVINIHKKQMLKECRMHFCIDESESGGKLTYLKIKVEDDLKTVVKETIKGNLIPTRFDYKIPTKVSTKGVMKGLLSETLERNKKLLKIYNTELSPYLEAAKRSVEILQNVTKKERPKSERKELLHINRACNYSNLTKENSPKLFNDVEEMKKNYPNVEDRLEYCNFIVNKKSTRTIKKSSLYFSWKNEIEGMKEMDYDCINMYECLRNLQESEVEEKPRMMKINLNQVIEHGKKKGKYKVPKKKKTKRKIIRRGRFLKSKPLVSRKQSFFTKNFIRVAGLLGRPDLSGDQPKWMKNGKIKLIEHIKSNLIKNLDSEAVARTQYKSIFKDKNLTMSDHDEYWKINYPVLWEFYKYFSLNDR